MLEPCDAKVSCTVLRGLGDRKVARLLGSFTDHFDGLPTIRPDGSVNAAPLSRGNHQLKPDVLY
jgi:hypothetical protein